VASQLPFTSVQGLLSGYLESGGSNGQVLGAMIAVVPGQVRFVAAYSAGGGGTTTILDLQNNGVSVWKDPANRPTLSGAASGRFASGPINHSSVRVGDVLVLLLAQAGNKTKMTATVAIEDPSPHAGSFL
jgi:hypothetical protein